MTVFVDTSAFVALENRKDTLHAVAVRTFRRLLKDGVALVTSDYCFDETLTLLKLRASAAVAAGWGRRLLASALFEVVFVDRTALEAGLDVFEGASDQPFSFTDYTSFALMRSRGIDSAFAFDDDFASYGFRQLPARR